MDRLARYCLAPPDERLALDLGADAFIIKPAEPEAFMARIQAVLSEEQHGKIAAAFAGDRKEGRLEASYSEVLSRKLEQKVQQLEEANRELILSTPEIDDSVRESATLIGEAGERATALTRQLLGFSRQSILKPEIIDMNGIVEQASRLLQRLIGADIEFSTVLTPGLSPVKVDPGQLDQILMNLAINARDAMAEGGKLTIETANVTLSEEYAATHLDCKVGPHVMLAVTDSGVGMTRDVMARIFEPFYTTKAAGKGTGLGLSMVFGIVQQSGGCLNIYSEPGHGTTIKIYLPAVTDETTSPDTSVSRPGIRGTETILLVEDDDIVRKLAMRSLETHGYHVIEAADGDDALKVASEFGKPIDVVLTDVVIPNISGPEVAERLKALYPGIKVLFMSGYTDDAVVRHGLLNQSVAFIQKPFTPLDLVRKIRDVLDT